MLYRWSQLHHLTSPIDYVGLSEGHHNFFVRAVDTAGNAGPVASFTWTIDTTAPDTTIDSATDGNNVAVQPGGTTRSQDITFTFSSPSAPAGVHHFGCNIDGHPYGNDQNGNCTSPVILTAFPEGSHTFTVGCS